MRLVKGRIFINSNLGGTIAMSVVKRVALIHAKSKGGGFSACVCKQKSRVDVSRDFLLTQLLLT